jgi:hypothetical protein
VALHDLNELEDRGAEFVLLLLFLIKSIVLVCCILEELA